MPIALTVLRADDHQEVVQIDPLQGRAWLRDRLGTPTLEWASLREGTFCLIFNPDPTPARPPNRLATLLYWTVNRPGGKFAYDLHGDVVLATTADVTSFFVQP